MEIDWQLFKKVQEDQKALSEEFKKEFFGQEENKNYFYDIEASAYFTSTEFIIKTPYNIYRFNKKLDDTFVFKKDKVEHYVYDIDGKYSFENWKKLIQEAEQDFKEVLAISDDVIAWLDKNSKRTISKNVSKFFGSWFSKKDKQATIEYKADSPNDTHNENKFDDETNESTQSKKN